MRHNIEMYRANTRRRSEAWQWAAGISVLLAFAGMIVGLIGLDPTVSNQSFWAFAMVLPGVLHLVLNNTHVTHNLGPSRGQLMQTYKELPKRMRNEMTLTREDVINMNNNEVAVLKNKMIDAREAYNKMHNTNLLNAHDYLDAVTQAHREQAELR